MQNYTKKQKELKAQNNNSSGKYNMLYSKSSEAIQSLKIFPFTIALKYNLCNFNILI